MRIFRKDRNSEKYRNFKRKYEKALKEAKKSFKKRTIDDVLTAKSSQWYQKLKRLTNSGRNKSENVQVDEICHLSDEAQAEAIADSLSAISNEYQEIKKDDISIPPFSASSIPQIRPHIVRRYLKNIKTNKSTAPGDIPARIIKEYALFLCVPVADIINTGLRVGQ